MRPHLTFLLALLCATVATAQIDLTQPWKFKTGDVPGWADPTFDDRAWISISPTKDWESQGFANYDGYAWYRFRFVLPSSLRDKSHLKDGLRLLLGKIDDVDMVFLNGKKIAQTGQFPTDPGGYATQWEAPRRYLLTVDDPILHWDVENVLAVRVYDGGGGGGFFGNDPKNLNMVDLSDFLSLDVIAEPFVFSDKTTIKKKIMLENKFTKAVDGEYVVQVFENKKTKPAYEQKIALTLGAKERRTLDLSFPNLQRARVLIRFTEKITGAVLRGELETPYLLTPPDSPKPKINNPEVYGARPGHPFLYAITATGDRPMQYQAAKLPAGLRIDARTGIVSGVATDRGIFSVTLSAANSLGTTSKIVNFVIGDNIALTPPMGWNSWNCWGLSVSDAKVRQSADALLQSGLANHGWTYMNIDDGWEALRDTVTGEILTNEKFPNMRGLADYLHSNGLKIGIYSSPGPFTCGGYTASWQHEEQDARTWEKWGIDYLKYDWCSYGQIAPANPDLKEMQRPYRVMQAALAKTNRDIVYSLCQYGMGNVWEWGDQVGGNVWRTTGDITDTWESLEGIGFQQNISAPYAKSGHWNDPDMLIVGWVGWGDKLHQTRLSPSEQYTHISLWAMLSAPLLIGCDIARLDDFTKNLLSNDEVIAIDQDAAGKAGRLVQQDGDTQIWVKELNDGSRAVAIFNRNVADRSVTVDWAALGLKDFATVRDVWRQQDVGKFKKTFTTEVYGHGVALLRVY